ncbi:MAG: cysteine--tRNA ligase, partial [Pseudomonadota bacterium]
LRDRGIPGEVIRFVLLSTHYRKPMDWTERAAAEAERTLRRWRALAGEAPGPGIEPDPDAASPVAAALADDLNTPAAIAALHAAASAGDARALRAGGALLGLLEPALGGWEVAEAGAEVAAAIEALLAARAAARQAKDFARADALRDGLAAAGVEVQDRPGGADWSLGPGFDPAKLEALR